MKPGQWVVAGVVLAVMVFAVTFAMNYLGSPAERPLLPKQIGQLTNDRNPGSVGGESREGDLEFITNKVAPFIFEDETRSSNYRDIWFRNPSDGPIVIGVKKLNCRCSAVEVSVLYADAKPFETSVASCLAARPAGPLVGVGSFFLHLSAIGGMKEVSSAELLHTNDSFSVPAGAVGWIRLRWKGEKTGPLTLIPELWLHNKDTGPSHTFQLSVFHHEPIRLSRTLRLGIVSDDELEKGITRHVYVWSSTRAAFKLQAEAVARGKSAEADPFEVGSPEPLNEGELRNLEKANNPSQEEARANGVDLNARGRVLSGYKVPVTLRSTPGKVPCDIGQFLRTVKVICPDVGGDPHLVSVTGRVRGLVELGNDDDGTASIEFGPFPRREGARNLLQIQSSVEGLKLEFDRDRTREYLAATLKGPTKSGESRQAWVLQARVLKDKASGHFPRAEDPLYEDSAIYLKATAPGRPPRSIRIATRGTANES